MSVALWTVGGLWTALLCVPMLRESVIGAYSKSSLLVYLEFGNALPFNGGELIYVSPTSDPAPLFALLVLITVQLDEIYRRPELLTTILFSGFFLCLSNSYGNSIQFAKHVLLSANPDVAFSTTLDPRLLRFIAVSVVTLACLIHYFSSKSGLFLNKILAWYKILLLLIVFTTGFAYSRKHGSEWHGTTAPANGNSMDSLAAMVLIFYAYQGWENANYVSLSSHLLSQALMSLR
jgi:amino acid transporter